MDKHFLIAVSEQKSALFGIRFVGNFFSTRQDIKSTLFYSVSKPSAVWDKERNLEEDRRQKKMEKQLVVKGNEALELARKECISMGFLPDNIFLKLQTQVFSRVGDIIQETEQGQYDALVIGRRGISMLEEAFEESVSKSLFHQPVTFPIWLCRSNHPNRKNVLLYLDGSETSFRMADHVGYILNHEKTHRLDVLISQETPDASSVMEKAKTILLNHGIPQDRIRQKSGTSGGVAKQILKEVEKEAYAAVALGRSSQEKGLLMRLFKSQTCSTLFKELEDAALWICH